MYWEGKCFFCIFWGTLALIVGLSAKPIYNDIKSSKKKKNKTTVVNENKPKSDSTTINY